MYDLIFVVSYTELVAWQILSLERWYLDSLEVHNMTLSARVSKRKVHEVALETL